MKKFMIRVDGVMHEVEVEEVGGSFSTPSQSPSAPVQPQTPASVPAGKGTIVAPLQGNVQEVKVKVGDKVNTGDVVVIIEAMKMENDVPATVSGIVKEIKAQKGTKVSAGDVLIIVG